MIALGNLYKVREDLETNKEYMGVAFIKEMEPLKGKYVTVADKTPKGNYRILESRWVWSAAMFDMESINTTKKEEINIMRDIFAILKHEGHKLDVIEFNGETSIGCIDCGVTLYKTDKESTETAKDIKKLYDFMKDKGYTGVERVITKLAKLMTTVDAVHIEKQADLLINSLKDLDTFRKYNFNNTVHTLVKSQVNKRMANPFSSDIDSLLKIAGNADYESVIKTSLISFIKDKYIHTSDEFYDNIKLICDDSAVLVVSNQTYELGTNDLMFVNKKWVLEEEEKFPTVTDIYKIKDMKEFYTLQGDWEDEENEEESFIKFKYRMENGLYDLSNLDLKRIMLDGIDCLREYDGNERWASPMLAALKIIMNK